MLLIEYYLQYFALINNKYDFDYHKNFIFFKRKQILSLKKIKKKLLLIKS